MKLPPFRPKTTQRIHREPCLTFVEVADALGVDPGRLKSLCGHNGGPPKATVIGANRTALYHLSAVRKWYAETQAVL